MQSVQKTFINFSDQLLNIEKSEHLAIFKTILCDLLQKNWHIAFHSSLLSEKELTIIENCLLQLKNNIPIQYITNKSLFNDAIFYVNNSVLIPRQETEELVQHIIARNDNPMQILDICTGSGCIAISLAKHYKIAKVHASDISPDALKVARHNADLHHCQINYYCDSILSSRLPLTNLSLIVSNPPYIHRKEADSMHPRVLQNEPHLALFVDDDDPLVFYKHISIFANERLIDGGKLYFEINPVFENKLSQYLAALFQKIVVMSDSNGKKRFIEVIK
ncbi:MAG: hypothetical protein RIQ89_397 [Bacteroidota bacterium]|jgi:release factor glutamine methyltransferase